MPFLCFCGAGRGEAADGEGVATTGAASKQRGSRKHKSSENGEQVAEQHQQREEGDKGTGGDAPRRRWVDLRPDTLHKAAAAGDVETLQAALAAGASAVAHFQGDTPLHAAAGAGQAEAILVLLTYGASVLALGVGGATPLHAAAAGGHAKAIQTLLTAGAELGTTDDRGRSALHLAAGAGAADALRVLLAAAPNPGVLLACMDREGGLAPLHHAVRSGSVQAMLCLLAAGANADAVTVLGQSPLHLAVSALHLEAVQVRQRGQGVGGWRVGGGWGGGPRMKPSSRGGGCSQPYCGTLPALPHSCWVKHHLNTLKGLNSPPIPPPAQACTHVHA